MVAGFIRKNRKGTGLRVNPANANTLENEAECQCKTW